MKLFKLTMLLATTISLFIGCVKSNEEEVVDCEENNTTKVTYTNTGTVSLRVQVATSLTPQYVPINPILTFDLAPGVSVTKEFSADKYFTLWYNNCATTCNRYSYHFKTFDACGEYEEKQGI